MGDRVVSNESDEIGTVKKTYGDGSLLVLWDGEGSTRVTTKQEVSLPEIGGYRNRKYLITKKVTLFFYFFVGRITGSVSISFWH